MTKLSRWEIVEIILAVVLVVVCIICAIRFTPRCLISAIGPAIGIILILAKHKQSK